MLRLALLREAHQCWSRLMRLHRATVRKRCISILGGTRRLLLVQRLSSPRLIASTKIIPCPAGTIAKTAQVSLAQALAQHESYAQMPTNPQAPTAAERAAIHALIDAKHLSLTSEQAAAVQPLTACGATSSASLQWTADSVGFYSTIHWFKYTNCSQVLLDEAHLNIGYFSFGEQWDWGSDVYYNDQ